MTTTTLISPYGAAKIVNGWLKEYNETKQADQPTLKALPPQMFYSYVAKEYIPSDEDKKINQEDLKKWFDGYLTKKVSNETKKTKQAKKDLGGNEKSEGMNSSVRG